MDFRDSLFEAIHVLMRDDADALVITNDMSAMKLDDIRKQWPERVINIGIAEQNMMSVAGGLARCGKTIFGFGIGAHLISRAWEQIKLDICASNLPVMLIGVGGGLAYGNDGVTHHATEDVALMLTLPNMAVYNPCDPVSTVLSIRHAYHRKGPAYLRLDKEQVSSIYAEDHDITPGFAVFRKGNAATLLSTGVMTHRALAAADILAKDGIKIRVVDVSRLKPFSDQNWKTAIGKAPHVFTLEEHNITNGFGAQAAVYLAQNRGRRLTMLGLPDEFLRGSASRNWAHAHFGLTPDAIAARIKAALKS